MSNILFLYENNNPTVSMSKDIFTKIDKRWGMNATFSSITSVDSKLLNLSDVVWLIRPTDFLSLSIAREAKNKGKFVITYCDDDLINRPNDIPVISWRRINLRKSLEASDIIISSSHRICEKYKGFTICNRSAQIDTIVYKEDFGTRIKTPSDKIRIVYAANSSHASLFERFVLPSFEDLSKLDVRIAFTFIGVHPSISYNDVPSNISIEFVDTMPFIEYRKYMNENSFDIGLAPICDDEFSKCKYINKFIEYSLFNIVGIYSKLEPYTYVVEHKKNGFLVDNTVGDWTNILVNVINNPQLISQTAGEAQNTLRTQFTEESIIKKMIENVPELTAYSCEANKMNGLCLPRLKYKISIVGERIYLVLAHLKKSGLKGLIKKIRQHSSQYKAFNKGGF